MKINTALRVLALCAASFSLCAGTSTDSRVDEAFAAMPQAAQAALLAGTPGTDISLPGGGTMLE